MDPRDFADSTAGELVPILEGGVASYAFVPQPLPRSQSLSPRTVNLLGQAENTLGRLQGSVGRMMNPYFIARPLLRREAILSSRMEGTRTTAAKLVSLEAAAVTSVDPETREVANYVDAMNHGVALLENIPLCLRLVRELHEKLLTGVRGAQETPGKVRRVQNFIGQGDIAAACFVPPPPERLEPLLKDFEQYLNLADSDDGVPLLVRIAMAHYQFETIHPFRDGNGRVGRLLVPLTLLAHGRMTTPTLYVSSYFEQHKRRYVDLMLEVSQTGVFAPWIDFFLEALSSAADESGSRADHLIALRERYHDQLHQARSSALTLKLVDALFELPLMTTQSAMAVLNVTAATAGQHLNRLVDVGILSEFTGRKRDRQYMARELLAAIGTDDESDDSAGDAV